MRYIFLFFLFLPFISSAQPWKEKHDQFYAYLQNSDYSSAVKAAEEFLPLMEKDTVKAVALFYAANTYAALSDFDNAIKYAEEEKNIREKFQGKKHGNYLNAVYYLANYLTQAERYEEAIPYYLEVYREMKIQYPGEANTVYMAQSLADMCYQLGVSNIAQELYEDSWEWIRSSYSPEDSVYIKMTYTLSDFYVQNSQIEKAAPFFIMECDRQEKVHTKKSDEYLTALNSLGEFYIVAGKFDMAEKTYTDFVKHVEAHYGKKSADYATALNNLAVAMEKQSKYEEAEKLYLKSLELKGKIFKKESNYYALTLMNIGVLYDYMKRYKDAEKYFEECLSIYDKIYKEDNTNYATAMMNIASIYTTLGKNDKAIEMLKKSLEMNKNVSGELSLAYVGSLNNLGVTYQVMGNIDSAERIFVRAAEIYENLLGKNHTDYGEALRKIASIQMDRGNPKKAIELLEVDATIQEKTVGKSNSRYIDALQGLTIAYSSIGLNRKAEELYTEYGELSAELYGKLHPDYALYLNNYGNFLMTKGDLENAEKCFNEALKIQNDAFGENDPVNIHPLSNLASVQAERNNFKEAEKNIMKAFDITKSFYKPEQSEYAQIVNTVATLYYFLANYEKAELYYKEALELKKKYYGENHTEYASALNNMGTLYLSKATSEKNSEKAINWANSAVDFFKQSIEIDSAVFGMDNIEMTSGLNNLGEAYRVMGETKGSERALLKSIEIIEKNLSANNRLTAVSYNNLSMLYSFMKRYEDAEKMAEKALSIFDEAFGKNSSPSINTVQNLGAIYEATGRFMEAKEKYLQSWKIEKDLLEQNFSFLSESEKESYITSIKTNNYQFNTFSLRIKDKDPTVARAVYENEIYQKGLLFRSSSRVKAIVMASKDEELKSDYYSWMDLRQELSVLYATPEDNRQKNIKEVEEKANALEKSLVSKSDEVKSALSKSEIKWTDVRNKLKPGQAAIEFIQFLNTDDLSEIYVALILTPNSESPEMTYLFSEDQLKKIIGNNSGTTYESVSALYGKQKKLNVELFSLVWGPLEKSLKGINEIFYSPAGSLHKISFSSLGDMNGRFVSDKYQLHQVNSTASLLEMKGETMDPSKSMLALVGGVKYDSDKSSQHVWSYLPGTLTETEHIQSSLAKSGVKTEILTAELASEENLKKMDGEKSPTILHVATHGFFFGDPNVQKEKIEKQVTAVKFRGESRGVKTLVENPNPLMRSGIVLAGANDVWNETQPGIKTEKEDGILTAYEVSLMDFQNTKLVVLSACETGLGDIKGSEGVYGLQRAFRIAGVDKLIMSLWQVPDKETEEFMTSFYNELIKTKEIRKSFTNAQKMMRAKYDPYFWGAFVLIE